MNYWRRGLRFGEVKLKNPVIENELAPIPYHIWLTNVLQFLVDNFDEKNVYAQSFIDTAVDVRSNRPERYHLTMGALILKNLKKYLQDNPNYSKYSKNCGMQQVELLCNRFHLIASQLRSRRENRATIEVEDEYDAQDLLHSLLKVFFDDIVLKSGHHLMLEVDLGWIFY